MSSISSGTSSPPTRSGRCLLAIIRLEIGCTSHLEKPWDGRLAFVVFRRLPRGRVRVSFRRQVGSCYEQEETPSHQATPSEVSFGRGSRRVFRDSRCHNVWNQLPKATPAKASQKLAKSIQEQHRQARSPISLRLGADQTAAAKKIAAAQSVGCQTQLRMWIAEGIRREAKRA